MLSISKTEKWGNEHVDLSLESNQSICVQGLEIKRFLINRHILSQYKSKEHDFVFAFWHILLL